MGNAYPKELRQRVIETYLEGDTTKKAVARRFKVSYPTVRAWLKRYEDTGSYEALPDSGGRYHTKILPLHEDALESWLAESPGATQLELAKRLELEFGLTVCQATISNALARRGMTFKKNTG